MPHFSGDKPVTFSQARRGEVIVSQGHGKRPLIYRPSKGSFREAGFPGPGYGLDEKDKYQAEPAVVVDGAATYYVARVDIMNPGSGYNKPPKITLGAPPTGGVQATAIARIQSGGISAVEVTNNGKLYGDAPSVRIDENGSVGTGMALSMVTTADPDDNLNTPPWHYIQSVTVRNGGSGYAEPPLILLTDSNGWTGYGKLDATVENGSVVSVNVPNPQVQKLRAPAPIGLKIGNGAGQPNTSASLLAIMRATFRGKYQCYYRWADSSVPKEEGGPLYSNLSPVKEIDTGHAAGTIRWSIPTTPPAGATVELWRSSSNQATTLYKVTELPTGVSTFVDQLNDHELTDSSREGFLAMPILLPNGELNANRFGVPPADYAVSVMFQDRLWMAVDTTGTKPNYLRFSEMDEPESMPDVNEIIVQQNLRSGDYITALIPYAGALVVCQSRHSHRLTYVSQPLVDVGVFMLAYRGCLNQRCWDIYDGTAYIMDEQGVYSLDPQGKVEGLTIGLDDLFQTRIDWSKRQWFIVRADRQLNVLRCSVAFHGDSGKYPTRQLVYALDFKAWWEERHPQTLVGATDCRTSTGSMVLIYGSATGNCYRLGEGSQDLSVGAIAEVVITIPGRGYRTPPSIRADGGSGAEFSCGLNSDGQITGIQIRHCGTGYRDGNLIISAPEGGGEQAAATFTVRSDSMPVHYTFRTGNMEFITDEQDKRGGETQNRQVSVVYKPTKAKAILNLEAYYNGASYPRSNVVSRNRGVGFTHSDTAPAATLDMQATPQQNAEAHGVARALFSGRTLEDMAGSDRHIAIGLSGKQDQDSGRLVIYSVDVHGVNQSGD